MKIQKVLTGLEYNRPITREQFIKEFQQGCEEKVLGVLKNFAQQNKAENVDKFVKNTGDLEENFVSSLGKLEGEHLTPGQLWEL